MTCIFSMFPVEFPASAIPVRAFLYWESLRYFYNTFSRFFVFITFEPLKFVFYNYVFAFRGTYRCVGKNVLFQRNGYFFSRRIERYRVEKIYTFIIYVFDCIVRISRDFSSSAVKHTISILNAKISGDIF